MVHLKVLHGGSESHGTIPPEIGNLTNLEHLSIQGDDIPPELGNLTNLQFLSFFVTGLANEKAPDEIPPELGNLTNLEYLHLSGRLAGEIPPELGNLTNLEHLHLSGGFTGEIPLEQIGNLTNLEHLHVVSGRWTGEIPPELGNLTNLEYLYLYGESWTGEIPPELGNLTNLRSLSVRGDPIRIVGCLPANLESQLVVMRFRGVTFCSEPTSKKVPDPATPGSAEATTSPGGSAGATPATPAAPDNLGDRNVLVDLFLGTGGNTWPAGSRTNWLSSQPMGQWAGVTTEGGYVTGVDLGGSNLAGPFPQRLGELTRLRSANLRGNQLTGCIPYNQRLRDALADSYQEGPEPGWELVILNAIYNVIVDYGGLEAIRDPQVSLGWDDFVDRTYGLGLAPCPPPLPSAGVVAYDRQSAATDRQALLAIRDHFVRNGTPKSSFESWRGEMRSESGVGPFRSGWRGVTLDGQGRVVKLWLDERDLRGEIPAQLGSLGQLVELNLSKNELTGSVPAALGHLRNLRLLALNQNFTPKASEARGATDGLTGQLPPQLGHLGELRRLVLDDNPFLVGLLPQELGNLTNIEYLYLQDTGFTGCLPPPIRQNFSPTLGSLLNELLQGLTIDRVKVLMTDEIEHLATARGFAEDVADILEYNDESFHLFMEYAPLNQALDEVTRAISVVSPDTIIKPGSTLSDLGNVKLTC